MVTARRVVGVLAGALVAVLVTGGSALAQTSIDPTVLPERNTGGWIFWLGWLSGILALLLLIFLVAAYMRFAPRFAKDEEGSRFVHADRVLPGKEPPRRIVDLTQAAPIVVQPPPIPAAVGAPAVGAPAVASPAAAPAPAPTAAPTEAPAPAPSEAPAPETSPAPAAEEPALAEPEPAAAPAAAPPAPAAAEPRPEVSLDQATFDKTLEELLAQGTDRRIAEGKARRAAMIAARKKAAGEG